LGRAIFGREQDAIAGPGEAAVALVDVDAEVERGEAGDGAELFGDELVKRDGVPEAALEGAARGGE